jgi:hypothetical protein
MFYLKWFDVDRSFWLDLKIIAATALAIVATGSRVYLKWFDVEGLLRESTLRGDILNIKRYW